MHQLEVPFRLRERDGIVTVRVERNDNPDDLGLSFVAVGYDRDAFTGFPVMEAVVHYDGRGPRAWMGWLQVISWHDVDGTRTDDVDALSLGGGDSPLYTFGYAPTLSDCPANPSHPDGDWTANTYLVAVPDVMRSKVLQPITGFPWGYRLRSGKPESLFEPSALPLETWDQHRERLLASSHPAWTFLPSSTE